jgi:hypothetical protein
VVLDREVALVVDLRVEVLGLLVAPNLRVDHRNDGDGDTTDWGLRATGASGVVASHGEEVLI